MATVSAGGPKWLPVNLAASQWLDADLPRRLERLLMQYDVPAARLGVELTESMAMRDVRASHAVLQAIRECGVSVSLDDFGTGYSSLSQLHEMPVDKLKIDRSFIERVSDDEGAARIVEAIAALALTMGLSVVAEGVQTAAQIRALRRLRLHKFQRYGTARPMRL